MQSVIMVATVLLKLLPRLLWSAAEAVAGLTRVLLGEWLYETLDAELGAVVVLAGLAPVVAVEAETLDRARFRVDADRGGAQAVGDRQQYVRRVFPDRTPAADWFSGAALGNWPARHRARGRPAHVGHRHRGRVVPEVVEPPRVWREMRVLGVVPVRDGQLGAVWPGDQVVTGQEAAAGLGHGKARTGEPVDLTFLTGHRPGDLARCPGKTGGLAVVVHAVGHHVAAQALDAHDVRAVDGRHRPVGQVGQVNTELR